MQDSDTTISAIRKRLESFVAERDWEQFHAPKNLSMALAAEAGELLEHFLWVDVDASRKITCDPQKMQAIQEELADIVIYALEFANATGIDVSAAIENKIAQNARKYPVAKAKGNSLKYTEL